MSKQEDTTVEDKAVEFDVMPGADRPDEDDAPALDLSFETIEQEVDEVAEAEEVVAEDAEEETANEEPEEIVSEDEQSTEEETTPDAELEEEQVVEEK